MSEVVNRPKSLNDTVTTATHVLKMFEDSVRTEMPELAIVYDEQLSYETGMEQFLANSSYSGSDQRPMPIFIYNRTVLVDSELGFGSRAPIFKNQITIDGKRVVYRASYSEFEIQFLYVSRSTEEAEKFEVCYGSNDGISRNTELSLIMPELGEFKYFFTFDDLTEKPIEHEEVTYKGIIGTIKVRGLYFVFSGEAGIIEQINQKIYASSIPRLKVKDELIGIKIIAT